MILSETDKEILLSLAHGAITHRIAPGRSQFKPLQDPSGALQVNCGVFVSLYVDGSLRGCIGTFSEENTLYRNVQNMAVSAALSDSRFSPIKDDELEKLVVEISVLTPRERIFDMSEIILGRHGIYMEQGTNRGTLLPQVAISENWTLDEYLGNCSKYKAGIGWNGWKSADLYRYEAIVFRDNGDGSDC